jgi:ribosome-associated protein
MVGNRRPASGTRIAIIPCRPEDKIVFNAGMHADAVCRSIPMIRINETIALDEGEVEESFVRASGSGGQNANKTATAVELRFNVPTSSLSDDVKARLLTLAGRHLTTDGALVVLSRAFRSQAENRKAARARFVALLNKAATPPKERRRTKPGRAVREESRLLKERQSAVKRARRARGED